MNVRAPMTEEIRLTSILARQREAFLREGAQAAARSSRISSDNKSERCFTHLTQCSPEESPMTTKLIVIYDQPEDAEAFFKHYEEVHTPLVKRTPGLQRLVLNRVVGDVFGGSAPYAAIAEMDYPDRETFEAAMKSSQNQAVAKDLMSFANGKVKVLIAESNDK